jgi:hypothetical protein
MDFCVALLAFDVSPRATFGLLNRRRATASRDLLGSSHSANFRLEAHIRATRLLLPRVTSRQPLVRSLTPKAARPCSTYVVDPLRHDSM